MARKLTAWLSIGSTYSYLTAMRIKEVVKEEDINLSIIPISIRQIMKSMDKHWKNHLNSLLAMICEIKFFF